MSKIKKTLAGCVCVGAVCISLSSSSAAQERLADPAALPARAEVTYRGTAEAKITEAGRPLRRLDLNSLIDAANRPTREVIGAVTIRMIFDGPAITLTMTGTGGIQGGSMSGVVRDGVCRVVDPKGAEVWEGRCDARGFSGLVSSTSQSRVKIRGRFETRAEAVVDVAAREAQLKREQAQSAARAAADRQRELATRASAKAKLPAASVKTYEPMLERAVAADSAHWFMNRFRPGSVDLVQVQRDKSGAMFIRGYFSYADGREGWVGAIVSRGSVQCLAFWDDPTDCRAIGEGRGAKMGQAIVQSMLSPPRGGGGGCDGDTGEGCTAEEIANINFARHMEWQSRQPPQ